MKPKTLDDFPKFVVNDVRLVAATEAEYQSFEMEGSFDPILEPRFEEMMKRTGVQWFWLLFGERGCLTPMLKSLDKERRTAILTCEAKEEPRVIGSALAFLSPYWQPFHVWMVLDSGWVWEKRQFQTTDAVAEDYKAQGVSYVEGREVKIWTKLQRAEISTEQSPHSPASDEESPVPYSTRLVVGGWDHETANSVTSTSTRGWLDTVIWEGGGCARTVMSGTWCRTTSPSWTNFNFE